MLNCWWQKLTFQARQAVATLLPGLEECAYAIRHAVCQ
jgi:hypothetical protein